MFIGSVGHVVFPLAAAFAPNYPLFVILRMIGAAFNTAAFLSAFVISKQASDYYLKGMIKGFSMQSINNVIV